MEYASNITLHPYSSGPTYGLDNVIVQEVVVTFDYFVSSFFTVKNNHNAHLLRYKNYPNGRWTQDLDFNPFLVPNNLTQYMRRLAILMIDVMRSSSSKEMLYVGAYIIGIFISVRWEWLISPFALLHLSLAFLVLNLFKTSKDTATGV